MIRPAPRLPALRRPRALFQWKATGLALAVVVPMLFFACAQSAGTLTETPLPTSISVSPADFVGALPCTSSPEAHDGLGSYQVTLTDVTEGLPTGQFVLRSSNLVPCEQAVQFLFVVPGHRYVASIAAFDRRDLEARGDGSQGAVVSDTGMGGATNLPASERPEIEPRWTTQCFGTAEALEVFGPAGVTGAGGAGGAGGSTSSPMGGGGMGGLGGTGSTIPLGALAVENAPIAMRGCIPLEP